MANDIVIPYIMDHYSLVVSIDNEDPIFLENTKNDLNVGGPVMMHKTEATDSFLISFSDPLIYMASFLKYNLNVDKSILKIYRYLLPGAVFGNITVDDFTELAYDIYSIRNYEDFISEGRNIINKYDETLLERLWIDNVVQLWWTERVKVDEDSYYATIVIPDVETDSEKEFLKSIKNYHHITKTNSNLFNIEELIKEMKVKNLENER